MLAEVMEEMKSCTALRHMMLLLRRRNRVTVPWYFGTIKEYFELGAIYFMCSLLKDERIKSIASPVLSKKQCKMTVNLRRH